MTYRLSLHAVAGSVWMALVFANGAHAQDVYQSDRAEAVLASKPLLVLRFNQQNVYFSSALARAVEAAERAKPDVRYEIVSYVPETTGSKKPAEQPGQSAHKNLMNILSEMQALGVSESRIEATIQPVPTLSDQEIHIFVQ